MFLKPFEEIVEDNDTLLDIRMDRCHGAFSLTPKIRFYLSLNRAGRRGLLTTTDQSQYRRLWLDKVIENKLDPSVVFYFLSLNPSLLPNPAAKNIAQAAGVNLRKRKFEDKNI